MNSELKPKSFSVKQLIVLLHGVGSNGKDLLSLCSFMVDDLPETHFFAPNGIEKCDIANYGYQWFSLKDRTPEILRKEIEKSIPLISKLISDKQREIGVTNLDTILVGFSQGAMTAMYLALSQSFKGVIAFSGALITPEKLNIYDTSFCLIHGMDDKIVPYDLCIETNKKLNSLGIRVEQHALSNLSHSIDLRGINIAKNFIKKIT